MVHARVIPSPHRAMIQPPRGGGVQGRSGAAFLFRGKVGSPSTYPPAASPLDAVCRTGYSGTPCVSDDDVLYHALILHTPLARHRRDAGQVAHEVTGAASRRKGRRGTDVARL